jgi:hypothetical protein
MNRTQATALAVAIALAAVTVSAQEHQHSDAQPPATGTQKATGTMAPGMHEHMKKMHEQMEKIRNANDAAEREKLVQEHMRSMHDAMQMMGGGGGPMMHGQKGESGTVGAGPQNSRQMMAQCMEMMQKTGPAAGAHGKQP